MDALYDDSNIYSVEYNINNITDTYENINIQYYKSDVDHPMGTDYRKSADAGSGWSSESRWMPQNSMMSHSPFALSIRS